MELKDIISVPGMSGLYKVVANNKNGFIVESLADSKRTLINSNQRIMTLVDIAVYTTEEEMPLREIYKKIQQTDGQKLGVDVKADVAKLRDYFKKIVPNFDEERVYSSDIKKMLTWYELLKDKIDFSKEEETGGEADEKIIAAADHEKPIPKMHESHGPKAEHAKATTAKTRKKV
ncbi:MAG TPA: DUF5606 domain-containing protein [Bacteroidia bacterium]|nr:DUF5606 domain-containing protein [Bacteroidia bacterium]